MEYEVGDIVKVFGTVDGREFDDTDCVIVKKDVATLQTNVDEDGKIVKKYEYHGICYHIMIMNSDSHWWVPIQNIRKDRKEEKPGKIRWYKNGKLE